MIHRPLCVHSVNGTARHCRGNTGSRVSASRISSAVNPPFAFRMRQPCARMHGSEVVASGEARLNHILTLISALTGAQRRVRRGWGVGWGGERIKSVIRVYSLHPSGADGKALNPMAHTHKRRERAVMNRRGSPSPLLFTSKLLIGRDL